MNLLFSLLLLSQSTTTRALTTLDSAVVFKSCPPPRFDTFSDKLLGGWKWNDNDSENTKKGTVEEVMRSCGGAVQGIREAPGLCGNGDEEQGSYLNRANDGFVYFDQDASYSCGSVVFSTQEEEERTDTWLTSLTMGKSRLCVISTSVHGDVGKDTATASTADRHCHQMFRTSYQANENENLPSSNFLPSPIDSVVWSKITQCRLPALNQPWMLQRAKWESFTFDNDAMDIVDIDNVGTGSLHAWKMTQSCSDMTMYPPELRMSDTSTAFSIGGVCSRTGYVKSILRQYNTEDQSLQSVAWLEGRLMVESDKET